MMAGPSLTRASYAGPVALADELFKVSYVYWVFEFGSVLLWLKLHLWSVPGCLPCAEQRFEVGNCWLV